MARVCMLVKNSFEFDARVTKEARSLTSAGHGVTVIALHVPGLTSSHERRPDGISVIRVSGIYGRLRERLPRFLSASTTVATGATLNASQLNKPTTASATASRTALARPHLLHTIVRRVIRSSSRPVLMLNDLVVSRRMERTGKELRADVVHAHDLNTLAIGAAVASSTSARLVYDAHELHTARNDSYRISRFVARRRERRGITRADAVITATSTWAEMMAQDYGLSVSPTVLRNTPPHLEVTSPVDLRTRLHLPPEATILLYQGSVQTNRGIEQTLAALPHLQDCVLVICGYGAHIPALQEQVAALGLDDRVRFDGPIANDTLVSYSAGADIGLCLIIGSSLSYRTSLPNKLFEYFMAGIPVLASDFPEMGAVVRQTGAGEVCDPVDPRAIAAAVERLRAPARYAAATEASRAAANRFNWDSEQQRLLDLYVSIIP